MTFNSIKPRIQILDLLQEILDDVVDITCNDTPEYAHILAITHHRFTYVSQRHLFDHILLHPGCSPQVYIELFTECPHLPCHVQDVSVMNPSVEWKGYLQQLVFAISQGHPLREFTVCHADNKDNHPFPSDIFSSFSILTFLDCMFNDFAMLSLLQLLSPSTCITVMSGCSYDVTELALEEYIPTPNEAVSCVYSFMYQG